MNPFDVQKVINESHRNGERLVIEELSRRCGFRLRHAHLIMSKDMFECESCGGFPRHWIKGVSLYGWITLWNYKPPKETDFSATAQAPMRTYAEIKDLNEIKQEAADTTAEKE